MNFDFSPQHRELQRYLRRVLSETCPRSAIRRVVDLQEPMAAATWRELGGLGYLGAAVPEQFGGAGLGYLELRLVAQEIGRALAPLPLASSIYQVVEGVLSFGSETQKQTYLPRLASGKTIGCVVLTPHRTNSLRFDGSRLKGCAPAVVDASLAGLAVLAVPAEQEGHAETVVLVELGQDGVTRKQVEKSIDLTHTRSDLEFDAVMAQQIGEAGDGARIARQVLERACVMVAFEQLGGAERCLEMAKDYALTRHAFGRPIGSYQAIKHKLVDVYTKIEMASAHAYFAAWALSTRADDLVLAAASARVTSSEAYIFSAQKNIQVHGGVGFTWEHDCHLHYR